MANPLKQAIQAGIKANDTVGGLFARIGTSDHPRGFVLSAYRQAGRSLKTALGESNPLLGVSDVFGELKRTVRSDARSLIADAQMLGLDEAARQLRFYGVQSIPSEGRTDSEQREAVVDALIARVEAQELAVRALLFTEYQPEQILGDDERAGILRSSDIAPQLAAWAAAVLWASFASWASAHPAPGGLVFKKQVVAALDNRTTDCCLRVHGQVQPMNRPFRLTGTPRYADEMDWPAFHRWCRTSGVLFLDQFDDGLTAQMRDSADYFLAERADGRNPDRDPADAFK